MNKKLLTILLSVLLPAFLVSAVVYATTSVGDAVSVGTTLTVAGATTLSSSLAVTGATTLNGNVTLGNAVSDTLTVYAPLVWAATTTTYGIDLDAATLSTADIRLSNGTLIANGDADTLTITEGNIVLTLATTVAASAENHGLDVNFTGTVAAGSSAVAGNFVMTIAGTGGNWMSGVYGKVVQTTGSHAGYISGGEFEVNNTSATAQNEMFSLVLDSSNNRAYHANSAYIWVQDFGAGEPQEMPNLFKITDATAASGNMYYNETIKIRVNGSDRYIPLSTAEATYTTAYPIVSSYAGFALDINTGFARIGSHGSGVALTTDNPYGFDVHTKPTTALTAGDTGMSVGIHSRYEVGAAQTNQISIVAIEGQLRPKFAMADGAHAGVRGYVEADAVAFTGTDTTTISGGHFSLELPSGATLANDLSLCGVLVDANVNSGISMTAAKFVGIKLKKTSGTLNWETGIDVENADIGIDIGAATTGITLTGAKTTGINISGTYAAVNSKAITSVITVATPNYTDGYGANEFQLNTTGTVAGHTAAGSFWINTLTGGTGTGGSFLTPLNNGIYEESAATMANTNVIFGMRMQAVLGEADFSQLNAFSINSTQNMTALFDVNELNAKCGYTAASTQSDAPVGYIKFIQQTGGSALYIRVYTDMD